MANKTLQNAKKAKNDEFYTQLNDIEQELKHYKKHFKNKSVLCNCDDPYESNFFKFFAMNFNHWGLKKLTATSYDTSPVAFTQLSFIGEEKRIPNKNRRAYKIEINEVYDYNGDGAVDLSDVEYLLKNKNNAIKLLEGDGDFRSRECAELLTKADIVVTNPPFSLFREYVAQLIEYDKKFLIIGNQNAITYKEIFPLIKDNKMWLGHNNGAQEFLVPDSFERNNVYVKNGSKYAKFGNICWFTNLETLKRHEELMLYKRYTASEYPKYDNYDAINVDKVADIPCDYFPSENCSGNMGVPVTFLDKYNPDQFEIIKFRKGDDEKDLTYSIDSCKILADSGQRTADSGQRTQNYALFQNHCQTQTVTASWGFLSPSLISTTRINSRLSERLRARARVFQTDYGAQAAESHSPLSAEKENINDFSSSGKLTA